VSRDTRGPLLLVIAAILSLFAFGSYLIGDFRDKAQRREMIAREQGTLHTNNAQLIQERATLESRNDREVQERAELRSQYGAIIDSLRRIEKAVQSASR
jgi:hypothetical protein